MPKVSVILSSYNHEKYIAEAIKSVLAQTYQDFELLIFDDGSKDRSQEIINSFKDERIKVFCYRENRGPLEAAREAFMSAAGKYIAVHHSDDVWLPEKLEKQVDFMEANPDYAACFTQADFIDEDNEEYVLPDNHFLKDIFKKENRSRGEWLNYFFYKKNCLCHPSLLIKKDVYSECVLTDVKTYFQLPDYYMWIKLCSKWNLYILQENLVHFRLRRKKQENVSSAGYTAFVRGESEAYFIGKYFHSIIRNDEDFLNIFPEGKKFSINGQMDRDFGFAQLCLANATNSSSAFQLLGLEILHGLLHDSSRAEKIKKLYQYDENSFIGDTGKYDIFGTKHIVPILYSRLYMDYGEGYSSENSIQKIILIQPDQSFFLQFDCHLEGQLKALRFDPDDRDMLSMKILRLCVNGEEIDNYTSNAVQIVDGYHRFLTTDSQYTIEYATEESELCVQIFGSVEQDWLQEVEQNYKKMTSDLAYKDEVLRHQEEVLRNQQEALAYKDKLLQDADKSIADLKKIQSDILNSTSWKLTAPVRKVGKIMKSRNKK